MTALLDAVVALRDAVRATRNQRTMFLAAGLSFFAVFSLIPAAVAIVTVTGRFWGGSVTSAEVVRGLTHWVGPAPASFLAPALAAAKPSPGAGLLGALAVLLAGSVVFYQLRRILNVMWGVEARRGVRHELLGRTAAFLMVILMGFLMTLTVGAHATLGTLKRVLPARIPRVFWTGVDEVALFALLAGLISVVFKLLPASSPRWREVFAGALVTAGLLTVVNNLLGMYFSRSLLSGLYGAAAGFMVVLLWVYLSAEVFLFGAAFTGFYAVRRGWTPKRFKEAAHAQEEP
jgi:membrane protein